MAAEEGRIRYLGARGRMESVSRATKAANGCRHCTAADICVAVHAGHIRVSPETIAIVAIETEPAAAESMSPPGMADLKRS